MKKILIFSLIGLLIFSGCGIKEESTTNDDTKREETDVSCFTYELYETGIEIKITGYTCDEKDVVIPSKIDGIKVTHIGHYAFENNALTSVIIPNGVTYIGVSAFENNTLTSVTIPEGVTTIGDSAFENNALTSVTIPNSVTRIEAFTFAYNQLTSVTIPDGVTFISSTAFYDNALTSVTIPSSVTFIGDFAFYDNALTSVTIEGKISTADFNNFGFEVFGWSSGYSDSNIIWN